MSKFSPEASWDAVLAGRNVLAGTIHQVFEKKREKIETIRSVRLYDYYYTYLRARKT